MFRILRALLLATPFAAGAFVYAGQTQGPDARNAHLTGIDRVIADVELALEMPALAPAVDLYMALFAASGSADGAAQMNAMPRGGDAGAAGGAKFVRIEP